MQFPPRAKAIHYEDVPRPADASFAFREFRWPHFPFNWHYHPELELTLIIKGRGLRFVGDSVEQFREGDLCLLGANTPHCWASHASAPRGVRSLVIQFLPKVWGETFWHMPEIHRLHGLFERAQRGLAIRGTSRRAVGEMIVHMTHQPAGSAQRLGCLLTMLGKLADSKDTFPLAAAAFEEPANESSNIQLGSVLEFIHANLGPELTQQKTAAASRMSPQAFSRFFKRALRKTFVDYVNELKIQHACRALLETDQTVTEVAYAAGFNNLSHFNALFRRIKGMAPRDYRHQALDGVTPESLTSPSDWLGAFK